jgi:hypothetical protein
MCALADLKPGKQSIPAASCPSKGRMACGYDMSCSAGSLAVLNRSLSICGQDL